MLPEKTKQKKKWCVEVTSYTSQSSSWSAFPSNGCCHFDASVDARSMQSYTSCLREVIFQICLGIVQILHKLKKE